MAVQQLENGEYKVENQYARTVHKEGNLLAKETISRVFTVNNRSWRGIGNIPQSGYEVNNRYKKYNARVKFNIDIVEAKENPSCISGDIMKGLKKPFQCPNFGTTCKPEHPVGAPMVSSEGACAAYFHYHFSSSNKVLL
jgi:hydrogenase expression/formation protein HypD